MNKNISSPPTGRSAVGTGMGKPGGPAYQAMRPPPNIVVRDPEFALPAATAGHNDAQQSVPQRRPTQAQPRDNAIAYMAPKPEYTAANEGTVPTPAHETGLGRPGAPREVGAYAPPLASAPSGSMVQTDHTGRQPYAGREPMMVMGGCAGPGVTADSDTNPGMGGLRTGHDGPVHQSGNSPGDFTPSDQSSAAEQGLAVRNMVRAIARGNGGVPAETESPVSRGRTGGLRNTMENHEVGPGGLGVYPAGANAGQGPESHDGPADGS